MPPIPYPRNLSNASALHLRRRISSRKSVPDAFAHDAGRASLAVVEPERPGAAERGETVAAPGRDPGTAHLRDLLGLGRGAQHAEAGAAGDVGGDSGAGSASF